MPQVRHICGEGGDNDCNHFLWDLPCPICLLQVPWESSIVFGQRLSRGGAQSIEGAIEVGTTIQGVGNGGRRFPYLVKNLRGGGPGSPDVWVVDMGFDTMYWEGVGRIPPQGGL